MQNITLTQLTSVIATICMVSFLVNADDTQRNLMQNQGVFFSSAVVKAKHYNGISTHGGAKPTTNKFVFSTVDQNNNGKLSYQEVLSIKSQWLLSSFNAIDTNTDKSITEQEIVEYAYQSNKRGS
jgi:hypothetical protein